MKKHKHEWQFENFNNRLQIYNFVCHCGYAKQVKHKWLEENDNEFN